MMQRSSNTMVRNVLIGSISIILLISVLYYMKRVEVGRLKKDMDGLVIQRADREDELNRKLTEYLQKLEDMTRQLGDINSRLQECEDSKASVSLEVQKCKSVHSECLTSKEQAESNLKAGQTELNRVKAEHETLNQRVSGHTQEMSNLQHSLTDAEHELEQCEDSKATCQESLRASNAHIQECQQREASCQASLKSGARQAFNHNSQNTFQGQFSNSNDLQQVRGGGVPIGGGAAMDGAQQFNRNPIGRVFQQQQQQQQQQVDDFNRPQQPDNETDNEVNDDNYDTGVEDVQEGGVVTQAPTEEGEGQKEEKDDISAAEIFDVAHSPALRNHGSEENEHPVRNHDNGENEEFGDREDEGEDIAVEGVARERQGGNEENNEEGIDAGDKQGAGDLDEGADEKAQEDQEI